MLLIRAGNSNTRCRSPGGKAIKVMLGFRVTVLRRRSLRENMFDPLGRKVELNESDAAIEGFAVLRDQATLKTKAAHAFEKNGAPGGFWEQRGIAEAETRITNRPIAQGIEKIPTDKPGRYRESAATSQPSPACPYGCQRNRPRMSHPR
jgi:hypothetical protein